MVVNRMPSHGRASGWPADAWASSGRAMLIGIGEVDALALAGARGVDADDLAARVEQRAAAVAGVDRRVGLDEVGEHAALDRDAPADRRDDAARHRVGERAERAADGDRLLADLDGRRVADRCGRQAAGVDLDDREVGERVDAVDGCVERAAVLEVDGQLRRVRPRRRDGW